MAEIFSCAIEVAPLHAEPKGTAEQVTQALRGEPLTVHEQRGKWARVTTAYDYPGWIAAAALSPEAPGPWLPEKHEGDPIEEARAYLGAPYLWGGMSERGIDCSGLVHMAYRRLGHLVPRDAHEQEAAAEPSSGPRYGDLVTYGRARATHVVFWLRDGHVIHSVSGRGVVEEPEPYELRAVRRSVVRFAGAGENGR